MKSKILLCTLFVWSLLMINVFAIDGDGSEENPFLITTQEELELISDFPFSNFKLMNDIVLEGEWVPLCTYGDAFTGIFDGSSYTISNLQITGNYDKSGLFAENGGTIINLTLRTSKTGICYNKQSRYTYTGIIAAINKGIIRECHTEGIINYDNQKYCELSSASNITCGAIGGIAGSNTGEINSSCSTVEIIASMSDYFKDYSYENDVYGGKCCAGGIAGKNSGSVALCKSESSITVEKAYSSHVGGTVGEATSSIDNCFFIGKLSVPAYRGIAGGVVGNGYIGYISNNHVYANVSNCYAVCNGSSYGIGNQLESSNCFYDKDVSGLTDTYCGTPKSTLAMKMKATYTDWDFENVWGISSDKNDGYPYLLWEYEDSEIIEPSEPAEPEESTASVSIVKAESTADSLTMVSCVNIVGEHDIESFGTTFIPLWLFTAPDADVLNIEHNNADYGISNGETYSATITGIPEGYDDMVFVGKSYLKMANGDYIWSSAKSASVTENTLYKVNQ